MIRCALATCRGGHLTCAADSCIAGPSGNVYAELQIIRSKDKHFTEQRPRQKLMHMNKSADELVSCTTSSIKLPKSRSYLHHDDSQGDGQTSDATHEGPCPYQGKRPWIHPSPGAGGQKHPRRSTAASQTQSQQHDMLPQDQTMQQWPRPLGDNPNRQQLLVEHSSTALL